VRLGQVYRASVQRERLAAYADRGWLRAYLLAHDDGPIAFVVGTQASGVYHYEHPAYDPSWAAYNPGTVLLYRMLEDLFAHDRPEQFDFGPGDNEYKRLYSNRAEDAANILLVRRSAKMAFPYALHRASAWVGDAARRTLDRLEIRDKVRHLLRGNQRPANGDPPSTGSSAQAA
jgi:CelD/BcsL family acetyltransferase involved in cellulose biosynthesis